MLQIQLINNVIAWERRLEIEAAQKKNHPIKPAFSIFNMLPEQANTTDLTNKIELEVKQYEQHSCQAKLCCQPAG